MTEQHATSTDRLATYRRLQGRNRMVGVLRVAVPALGAVTLLLLVGQIYLSSLLDQFSIGEVSMDRESIRVEAPEYAGVLSDGSAYRVRASDAQAMLNSTEQIALRDAALNVVRPDGVVFDASADSAVLDTAQRVVRIEGASDISDSTGTSGTIEQSVFDWSAQTLTGDGPVVIHYADGTELTAAGMQFDAEASVWTFSGATVTLPHTPGAQPR
ncbi:MULTISPECIES: hypothetical protein [unclassified Devosia]|uniref:hypothetical protein n=1 Tax=unclassified Devosia TaxID=196773 RepID=UPI0015536C72|nr:MULTISPECIES: hypothetical protein [unclassified Devosia]